APAGPPPPELGDHPQPAFPRRGARRLAGPRLPTAAGRQRDDRPDNGRGRAPGRDVFRRRGPRTLPGAGARRAVGTPPAPPDQLRRTMLSGPPPDRGHHRRAGGLLRPPPPAARAPADRIRRRGCPGLVAGTRPGAADRL